MELNWIEIVGYTGSVLVAVSLMMKSMKKLRWINLIGAATFATYGLLLGAYPVFVLNGFITLVDVYYIFQMYSQKDYFEILQVKPEAAFLKRFLEYHCSDIKNFFPNVSFMENEKPLIFFTLRNMLPVALFIGDMKKDNSLEIKLDYVVEGYRDFKIGRYNYKNTDIFKNQGIKKLHIRSTVPSHIQFLNKMDFKQNTEQKDMFTLKL